MQFANPLRRKLLADAVQNIMLNMVREHVRNRRIAQLKDLPQVSLTSSEETTEQAVARDQAEIRTP